MPTTLLPVKHSTRLFYRFSIHGSSQFDYEFYNAAGHINSTWQDIEQLNYIFHIMFAKMSNEKNHEEQMMLMDSLEVVGKTFYIYLEIVRKLFENKIVKKVSEELAQIFYRHKDLWRKVAIARNSVIIHKEKPNFYNNIGSLMGTDPDVLYSYEGTYLDQDEKQIHITLEPLKDIAETYEFLKKFHELFNNTYPNDN